MIALAKTPQNVQESSMFPAPHVTQRNDNPRLFDLDSPYTVPLPFGLSYTVEAGFTTDMASTPFWTWWFLGPPSDYSGPAVPHDKWCRNCRTYSQRAAADALFLDLLHEWGTPTWKRYIMFLGLRLYARLGFWKNDCGDFRVKTTEQNGH